MKTINRDPLTSDTRKLRLILFVFSAALSIGLAFFIPDPELAENLFIYSGYPMMFLLVAVWGVCLSQAKSIRLPNLQAFLSWRTLGPLAAVVFLTVFLYTREGGGFKIPFDEQLLTNVSMNMDARHLPVVSETALENLSRLEMIDKRPLLYPFILSLVHGVFGYSSSNAFYLNFVLTGVFLLLLFKIVERIANRQSAYFSIILAALMPIISQNSSGGGFEMLNLCCILAVSLVSMDFWSNPDQRNLSTLLLTVAAASNVRYESALIVVPVAALVFTNWIRQRKVDLPWITLLIPFFFLPLVWQLRAIAVNPQRFQYQVDGEGSFSLSYIWSNLESAYRFFFLPNDIYASSPFVSFIGIAGIFLIGSLCLTRTKKIFHNNPNRVAFLATAGYCLIQLAFILTFFYGKLDITITARLGLPFMLLIFICGSIILSLAFNAKSWSPLVVALFLAVSASYSFKQYSKARYTSFNTTNARIEWLLDFARTRPAENSLFVSGYPRIYEIEGMNNISISRFKLEPQKTLFSLEHKIYDHIYVIQGGKITASEKGVEKTVLPIHELSPAFELETIRESSFTTHNFIRISKLVHVDPSLHTEPIAMPDAVPSQYYSPSKEEIIQYQESFL
ncbi:glycosyltransferase family 39 protein [Pelagicoccus sp. SDUM812002]|uniref:glycosyltransferase family 39 protein n=1 Tax=Pelagicoccus sp. SDUM812002 TaxID=3041266 RepID=UPI00281082DE|nr:glycosyltransferase family 39 protein [Pelagicoccus sp. SDUM812002]MDQ8187628.1 glycosyltransferase family 39 protein [Pelagicoccus sp. SDUM812002]